MSQLQHRSRFARFFIILLSQGLCFASVMSVGCTVEHTRPENISTPVFSKTITVQQLATQLQMRVGKCGVHLAELSNSHNSVVIIADPHARVLVNGLLLETDESITSANSTIIVPASLVRQICKNLKPDNYQPTGDVKSAKLQNKPQGPIVVLDPGHGGKDSGAVSSVGHFEKNIVLNVTRMVARQLRDNNVRVVMTREKDVYVGLDRRVDIANLARCEIFVSIHADAAPSRSARGFTVYVPRREEKNSPSHRAGKFVVQNLTGFSKNRGIRKHPSKNLRVLENTRCPAILIELGYLSNTREAGRLGTHQTQQRLADSIASAILRYLQQP